MRVLLTFAHHLLEPALQHLAAVGLVVTHYNLGQLPVGIRLNKVGIFVDKAEPELQKQIAHRIYDVLVGRLLEHGLVLGYQPVVVLQSRHIARHLHMQNALNVASGIVTRGYQLQNVEIASVVASELLYQHVFPFRDKVRVLGDDAPQHLLCRGSTRIHQQLHILGYTSRIGV